MVRQLKIIGSCYHPSGWEQRGKVLLELQCLGLGVGAGPAKEEHQQKWGLKRRCIMAFPLPSFSNLPQTSSHRPILTKREWVRKSEKCNVEGQALWHRGQLEKGREWQHTGKWLKNLVPSIWDSWFPGSYLGAPSPAVWSIFLPMSQHPALTACVCCRNPILITFHKSLPCLTCLTLTNSHGSKPWFYLVIYSQKALLLCKLCLQVFQSRFKLLNMEIVTASC